MSTSPEVIIGAHIPPLFGTCERCNVWEEVVSCIDKDGKLLARICEDCVRDWINSGLDLR